MKYNILLKLIIKHFFDPMLILFICLMVESQKILTKDQIITYAIPALLICLIVRIIFILTEDENKRRY